MDLEQAFRAGRWAKLEELAKARIAGLVEPATLQSVVDFDMRSYEAGLASMFVRAITHAEGLPDVVALYWEFGPDNGWLSSIGFCSYFDESDIEWPGYTVDWIDGPSLPSLAAIVDSGFRRSSQLGEALRSLAFVRTLAAGGRAYDAAGRSPLPMGASMHDSGWTFIFPAAAISA